jgi:hypothetical protein
MLHDGMGFTFTEIWTGQLAGTARDYLITTGVDARPHFRKLEFSLEDGPVLFQVFEDTVVSAEGTPITTIYNNNRNSSYIMPATMHLNPTVTDVGTQIHVHKQWAVASGPPGQASQAGAQDIGEEWILKPETRYLIRLTNLSAITVEGHAHFFGYHPSYVDE